MITPIEEKRKQEEEYNSLKDKLVQIYRSATAGAYYAKNITECKQSLNNIKEIMDSIKTKIVLCIIIAIFYI